MDRLFACVPILIENLGNIVIVLIHDDNAVTRQKQKQ